MKKTKKMLAALLAAFMVITGTVGDAGLVMNVQAEEQVSVVAEAGAEEGELITEAVDLKAGLLAGKTYGIKGAIEVSVLDEDMAYKTPAEGAAAPTKEDGTEIAGWVAGSNNAKTNGSTAKGSIPDTGASLKFVAVKDSKISVVLNYNSAKKYHFLDTDGTNVLKDNELAETAENTGFVTVTYDLEAGHTYYMYREGSKAQFAEITCSYVKVIEKVTESIDLKAGLLAGKTYGVKDSLEISVLDENMDYKTPAEGAAAPTKEDGTEIAGWVAGANNAKTNGSTAKGSIPDTGASLKFVAVQNSSITVVLNYNSAKKYHFLDTDGTTVLKDNELAETAENTGFVTVTYNLEAGHTYYMYREGSKAQFAEITYTCPKVESEEEEVVLPKVPVFEGAEGGGMYITGGRGGDVYVVTNLEDYGKGEKKIEGSFRNGVETAPEEGRIIVFNVGGTIHMKQRMSYSGRANITVAGQTAPGEGITFAGYDTDISNSSNIVFRFLHFRCGTENLLSGGDSMDALWGRDNDGFMVDHCTFSWNTDETLSTYRGKNGTVQWCLISESLTVSGHSKGRHGYGGIWGGDNTVFQYNLITNNTSRNPRIGGGAMGDPTNDGSVATLQLSNNVVYNHGYYACYGGGYTYTNYLNNYIKTGPGTRDFILDQMIEFGEKNKVGGVYVAGNVLNSEGTLLNEETANVVIAGGESTVRADKPYEAEAFTTVSPVSAEEAYNLVLDKAGVTYPKRDSIDARVVQQVKDNTGFFINTQDDVGGYCAPTVEREATFDTDMDGIPDTWETAHGLNPNDATDSAVVNEDGYAWVEVYFNELVKDVVAADYKAVNPTISLDLADNTLVDEGKDVVVTATAAATNGGSIAKVVFFNGAEVVGEDTEAPYTCTYTGLKDGTYDISARAYDNDGNGTQSNTSELHVNSTAGTGEWKSVDIGTPGVPGTASLVDGVMTVKGAGKLGKHEGSDAEVDAKLGTNYCDATTDEFHFVYQEMTGDMEIVTKLSDMKIVDAHAFNGVMFRESLDADAATVALGLSMVKIENKTVWSAYMPCREVKGGNMTEISESLDSKGNAEKFGLQMAQDFYYKDLSTGEVLGTYLKLVRQGDVFSSFASDNGADWRLVGRMTVDLPETCYVGFAVDANKVANDIENYATARFTDTEINTDWAYVTYDIENVSFNGATEITAGKDLIVTLTKVAGYVLPESVEVISASGNKVDYTYDSETGVLTLAKLVDDVTIKAAGVKRVVEPVAYEEIDANELLTVEKTESGSLLLTQTATTGEMPQSTTADDANVSYLLFNRTKDAQTLSMKITIKSLTTIDDGKNNGVFVGAFGADNKAFTTLGFRACGADSSSAYWNKAGDRVGNGSPKAVVALDTEYEVKFWTDKNGQYNVSWKTADGKTDLTKLFKSHENFMQAGEYARYGIALIGATAEITDMKLVDYEGNQIYSLNANGLIPEGDTFQLYVDGEKYTDYSGLYLHMNEWFYVENGAMNVAKNGLVEYDGAKFYVASGRLVQEYSGLIEATPGANDWYYLAKGMVQPVTQMVEYNGAWFVVKDGMKVNDCNGIYEYNGGKFFIAGGQWDTNVSGLVQCTEEDWYYFANGQVVNYTGLAEYNGSWFYVVDGKLDASYTGQVEYNGAMFDVVNGQVPKSE